MLSSCRPGGQAATLVAPFDRGVDLLYWLQPTHSSTRLLSNDFKGCGVNTVVDIATSFTTAECATFAQLWLALPAASAGTAPATVYTCTTNNCNTLGLAAVSGAAAVSSGVALVVAALALAATV